MWKQSSFGRKSLKQQWLNQLPKDPSLASQLHLIRQTDPLNHSLQLDSYLEACKKAPDASEGTKRKWRKSLGLT
jgi:hypothetical protein